MKKDTPKKRREQKGQKIRKGRTGGEKQGPKPLTLPDLPGLSVFPSLGRSDPESHSVIWAVRVAPIGSSRAYSGEIEIGTCRRAASSQRPMRWVARCTPGTRERRREGFIRLRILRIRSKWKRRKTSSGVRSPVVLPAERLRARAVGARPRQRRGRPDQLRTGHPPRGRSPTEANYRKR